MKIKKYIVIGTLLLSTIFLAMPVLAHPPQDMVLDYNLETSELSVTITHLTPAPTVHYIFKIDIELNDEVINSEEYASQPTTDTFTYIYIVEAEFGDVITVTAYCNISGKKKGELMITAPEGKEGTP